MQRPLPLWQGRVSVARFKRVQHPRAPVSQSELHPALDVLRSTLTSIRSSPYPAEVISQNNVLILLVLQEAFLSGLQQHPLGRNHKATERSGVLPGVILVDSVLVCLVRSGL